MELINALKIVYIVGGIASLFFAWRQYQADKQSQSIVGLIGGIMFFVAFFISEIKEQKSSECLSMKKEINDKYLLLKKRIPELSYNVKADRDVASLIDDLDELSKRSCEELYLKEIEIQELLIKLTKK